MGTRWLRLWTLPGSMRRGSVRSYPVALDLMGSMAQGLACLRRLASPIGNRFSYW